MAQLYFKYGTMNSGKSIEILKVAHNYEEQGKPVLLMTSSLDTRAGVGTVASRIGMKAEAVAIDEEMSESDQTGLKNDFRNELFEGSKYLLLLADKIEEIKTICWYCSKKATMVIRTIDGKPVYEGEQLQIGGNETYIPVCRKHYFKPEI